MELKFNNSLGIVVVIFIIIIFANNIKDEFK